MRSLSLFLLVSPFAFSLHVGCTSSTTTGGLDSGLLDDAAPSGDSGEAADSAITIDAGDCPGAMTQPTSEAVESLAGAWGAWRLSKTLSNGKATDVDECDSTIAYHIGPQTIVPAPQQAAACALSRGEVLDFRGGRVTNGAGCTDIACGPKYGMVWSGKSGSVFALDANGKPKGLSLFSFVSVPNETGGRDLVQSNSGSTVTGNLLVKTVLAVNCTM